MPDPQESSRDMKTDLLLGDNDGDNGTKVLALDAVHVSLSAH